MQHGVQRAIKNFGSQEALATALGVSQPTVSEWLRAERRVPTKRCAQIDVHAKNRAAEEPVRRWDLRPGDWWEHWPELIGTEGAPAVPSEETQHAA